MVCISLIIPVWRDTAALESLLQQLNALGWPLAEIIVVDGEHCIDNEQLCARHQASYMVSERGRGRQQNAAARLATGDWLWFVHADAVLLPEAFDHLQQVANSAAAGGYFSFLLQPPRTYWHAWLEAAVALRCRLHMMVYGDQALFVQREAFLSAGGFAEQPLFEEVTLVKALRARGGLVCAGAGVQVATRRWERDGWLLRSISNRLLATAYALGVSANTLHRWYTSGHETKEQAHD